MSQNNQTKNPFSFSKDICVEQARGTNQMDCIFVPNIVTLPENIDLTGDTRMIRDPMLNPKQIEKTTVPNPFSIQNTSSLSKMFTDQQIKNKRSSNDEYNYKVKRMCNELEMSNKCIPIKPLPLFSNSSNNGWVFFKPQSLNQNKAVRPTSTPILCEGKLKPIFFNESNILPVSSNLNDAASLPRKNISLTRNNFNESNFNLSLNANNFIEGEKAKSSFNINESNAKLSRNENNFIEAKSSSNINESNAKLSLNENNFIESEKAKSSSNINESNAKLSQNEKKIIDGEKATLSTNNINECNFSLSLNTENFNYVENKESSPTNVNVSNTQLEADKINYVLCKNETDNTTIETSRASSSNLNAISKDPSTFVKVIIFNMKDSNGFLNYEETDWLNRAFINFLLMSPNKSVPIFEDARTNNGLFEIVCNSPQSLAWINENISKLNPWPGALLRVYFEDQLPSLKKFILSVPKYITLKSSRVLELLRKQNKNLKTFKWKVYNSKRESNSLSYLVGIDSESIKHLEDINFKPYFGIGRASLTSFQSARFK